MKQDKFYTVDELAEMLKVNPMTIYRHIKEGRIEVYKVGRLFRISENALQKYLSKKGKKSNVK